MAMKHDVRAPLRLRRPLVTTNFHRAAQNAHLSAHLDRLAPVRVGYAQMRVSQRRGEDERPAAVCDRSNRNLLSVVHLEVR